LHTSNSGSFGSYTGSSVWEGKEREWLDDGGGGVDVELYDSLGTVGASIKQHLVEGVRNMWQQLNEFARSHTSMGVETEEDQSGESTHAHARAHTHTHTESFAEVQ